MPWNLKIQPPDWQPPSWKPADLAASLEALRKYAEGYAQASLDWYYAKKPMKAAVSRVLRILTIVATAVGGLMPVISLLFGGSAGTATEHALNSLRMNQYGYLSLGLAALFLALDRFLGSSSAWMRFIATAAGIETALEQFRFDWARLTAALGGRTPTGPELQALVSRITEFSSAVRRLVESETSAWVTEFQANLAEMERRTEAAVRMAREQAGQAEKGTKPQLSAAAPGAIDLTVSNAGETDAGYAVSVDDEMAKSAVASQTCGIMGIAPGLHELSVSGKIGGVPASASQVVTVRPEEATKVSVTLEKARVPGGRGPEAGPA
ncbi:MAG TPA: SLATT domain-containing protein [Bryobacteraceae bacterium]|nr:SLATT domain-containing protein [Bryobacteraceae bacterium]